MITKILWLIIAFFTGLSLFIGLNETFWTLLLIFGIASSVLGLCSIFNGKCDSWLIRRVSKSSVDEKLFPGRSGYSISRYLAGFELLIGGIGIIFLYFMTHKEIFNKIIDWFL